MIMSVLLLQTEFSSPILFNSPKEKMQQKNKYLLTFSRSTSGKKSPTLRRKIPQTPRKKFLSNVENPISEVKTPFLGQKRGENPLV